MVSCGIIYTEYLGEHADHYNCHCCYFVYVSNTTFWIRFSNRIDFDKTAAANVAEEKVDLRREATQR